MYAQFAAIAAWYPVCKMIVPREMANRLSVAECRNKVMLVSPMALQATTEGSLLDKVGNGISNHNFITVTNILLPTGSLFLAILLVKQLVWP